MEIFYPFVNHVHVSLIFLSISYNSKHDLGTVDFFSVVLYFLYRSFITTYGNYSSCVFKDKRRTHLSTNKGGKNHYLVKMQFTKWNGSQLSLILIDKFSEI